MNIFEQYGLKEVANVTFYDISTSKPVLFLDTLKVSNIEQTAENVEARGGWGNPALIAWDYNKEITLTLEDALFSPVSLRVMMGAQSVIAGSVVSGETQKATISMNEQVTLDADSEASLTYPVKAGTVVYYLDEEEAVYKTGSISGQVVTISDLAAGTTVRVFYTAEIDGTNGNAVTITIDAGTFGGTYKVVGDTLVRNKDTGKDEAFQFVMNKVKVNSEVTFTMEAEGDPATFNMPIRVLKDTEGNMFKLVKYSLPDSM